MTDRKRAALARLMLFTGAILWGSSYFVLKNTLDEVPLFLLLSIRFFFAGLILLAVRAPYLRRLNRRCLGTGALTGLFLALAYIFQTVGLTNTTPGTSAFLTTVYCVLVPFLSFAFTKRRPDGYNIVAAIACLAGIGLISLDTGLRFTFSGEGLTLIGGVFFALQIAAVEKWCADEDVILHTAIQFLTAFAVCFACPISATSDRSASVTASIKHRSGASLRTRVEARPAPSVRRRASGMWQTVMCAWFLNKVSRSLAEPSGRWSTPPSTVRPILGKLGAANAIRRPAASSDASNSSTGFPRISESTFLKSVS